MSYFDEVAESLAELKLSMFNCMFPEDILSTYADFPIKKIGVYRALEDLTTEERTIFDKYKALTTEEEFNLIETLFSGVCLSSTDGWVFLLRPNSIVRLMGFTKGEEIYLQPIDFGVKGFGFGDMVEGEFKQTKHFIGNTATCADLDIVDEIYFKGIRVNKISTKLN